MSNREHKQTLGKLLRDLGIDSTSTMAPQIEQFLLYSHHKRLFDVVAVISPERKKAVTKNSQGLPLTDLEKAYLDPERIWKVVRSQYNRQMREYAFLYTAFNVLEDTSRRAVDLHYCGVHGDSWYKNDSKYPNWVQTERAQRNKLTRLTSMNTGHGFMELLSFGEVSAFLYDVTAWTSHKTESLFEAKPDPEGVSLTLPKLTRCEVYEKLTILQWRRNAVYHHNLIQKSYHAPNGEGCTPKQARMNDGTFANTRDRVFEMLKYMGIKPKMVMERILGNSETLDVQEK